MTKFQSLMISSLLLVCAYGPGNAIQSDLASDAREPSSAVFAAWYVGAWTAFSLWATLLQWGLHGMGRLSPMMATTGTALGGSALILRPACTNGRRSRAPACSTASRRCSSSANTGVPVRPVRFAWGGSTACIAWAVARF